MTKKMKEKKLFNTVYQWGKNSIVTNENSDTFRKLINDCYSEALKKRTASLHRQFSGIMEKN